MTNSRMLQISRGITPKGQLRALPAPSHPNGDTSCYQHLHTHRSARRLHPTLYRGPWFRYSIEPGSALRSASYGGNGDLLADRSATVRTLPYVASESDRATEDPLLLPCRRMISSRLLKPEATQRPLSHAIRSQGPHESGGTLGLKSDQHTPISVLQLNPAATPRFG